MKVVLMLRLKFIPNRADEGGGRVGVRIDGNLLELPFPPASPRPTPAPAPIPIPCCIFTSTTPFVFPACAFSPSPLPLPFFATSPVVVAVAAFPVLSPPLSFLFPSFCLLDPVDFPFPNIKNDIADGSFVFLSFNTRLLSTFTASCIPPVELRLCSSYISRTPVSLTRPSRLLFLFPTPESLRLFCNLLRFNDVRGPSANINGASSLNPSSLNRIDFRRTTFVSIFSYLAPCFFNNSWNSSGAISGCRRAGSQILVFGLVRSESPSKSSGNFTAIISRFNSPTAAISSFIQVTSSCCFFASVSPSDLLVSITSPSDIPSCVFPCFVTPSISLYSLYLYFVLFSPSPFLFYPFVRFSCSLCRIAKFYVQLFYSIFYSCFSSSPFSLSIKLKALLKQHALSKSLSLY
ncbi:hypothetical protein AX774_g1522 [Zancudomyces culisetae]|uniref:Uncharacterized protein n=1 Tax=Zancudomyces culisetae TaxID=1213189 RepID=A0A1R1PVH1_ZANCU|nr:hypothetical protein AX774_g1522 [Zancudomyces culisetae]|eukprot:OMH84948.1 hypothetical protein AX774_g1522 [Zancudomyces culisetae]